ncbi:LLM class flavin-dependent oxidoreductase [Salinarimonas sp.]|uniref:LLM class flavin-dependent oxidoreductase n=1 Tax=Salinarimonas sp. TaxID=2766526 RepID=UPI0032D92477
MSVTVAPRRFTPTPRITNPMISSPNKMKLGVFGLNTDCGCAITTAPERLMADDWAGNLEIAKIADRAGFEALIPIGRWRGFGGDANFNGVCYETYTWAAGVAAVTDQIAVVTTSHVPTVHPLVAAKQAATVDHISGGRFGLNIICGWFGPEMRMFRGQMMEHDERYDYADEWLEIVQKAWNQHGYWDYDGKFFKVQQGFSEPKPLNRPVLVNAGGSPRGMRYCAEHCDVAFLIVNQSDEATSRKQVRSYNELAQREFNRTLQTWCYSYVVQRDTRKEAEDYLDYYVNQMGDDEGADNIAKELGIQTGIFTPEQAEAFKFHFKAGWAGIPLVGTVGDIIDQFRKYSDWGLDGICLSWLDYHTGIKDFVEGVMPEMEAAGLRVPFAEREQQVPAQAAE